MSLLHLFHDRSSRIGIDGREIAVLAVVAHAGPEGLAAADIARALEAATCESVRLATLYAILEGMELKGFVHVFEPPRRPGLGRPPRHYTPSDRGRLVLRFGEELAAAA